MNLSKVITLISNIDTLLALDETIDDFPCNIFVKTKNGTYIASNHNSAKTLGFACSKELIGLKDLDVLPDPDFIICSTNDKEVMVTDQVKVFMEPFLARSDGRPMIATSIKMPLRTKMNKVVGTTGFSIIQERPTLNKTRHQYGLTERQLDCLLYLAKGRSMKMIANELKLSPRTVEHYLEAAKLKLECNSRMELIEKALSISYIRYRL